VILKFYSSVCVGYTENNCIPPDSSAFLVVYVVLARSRENVKFYVHFYIDSSMLYAVERSAFFHLVRLHEYDKIIFNI